MQADAAEAALAYVMETAPVLALTLDAQLHVVAVNEMARRVLPEGAEGSLLAELVVDFNNSMDFTWLTAQRGSSHRLTIKTASGLPETYHFRFFPLAGGTLALGGMDFQEQALLHSEVLGLNRELNNLARSLHQANAELLELDQLKNQFLGMAAHDLRNPLGIIMIYDGFVLDGVGDTLSAEHRCYLEKIQTAARRMQQIIDDFLDVSMIESGNLRLELVPASVVEIVGDILPICQLAAEKKKVALLVDAINDRRRLPVDAPKLQQVLLNLVRNAVEYSLAGQRVWLSSQWDDRSLVFVVRDEGPGIAQEEQDRLFAAFGRANARKTAKERSVGLGLCIAHKIVKAHGGRLWVESTPGAGASFFAALPFKRLDEMLEGKCQ